MGKNALQLSLRHGVASLALQHTLRLLAAWPAGGAATHSAIRHVARLLSFSAGDSVEPGPAKQGSPLTMDEYRKYLELWVTVRHLSCSLFPMVSEVQHCHSAAPTAQRARARRLDGRGWTSGSQAGGPLQMLSESLQARPRVTFRTS